MDERKQHGKPGKGNNIHRDNRGRYLPGTSGNLGGAPRGPSIAARLRRILALDDGRVANALVEAGVKAALQGDFRFWQEILNRVDGKVVERVLVDSADPVFKSVAIDFDRFRDAVGGNGKRD